MSSTAAPADADDRLARTLTEDIPTGQLFRRPRPQPLTPEQQRRNYQLLKDSVSRSHRKAARP
ncbi:hypothetical protein [Streptomyces sp. NPDC093097]|uniref:hypothetical protein n=1 Tax=Streptomyces sp. NPDC093097 TaxID=3366027 RepID=UPI00381267D7